VITLNQFCRPIKIVFACQKAKIKVDDCCTRTRNKIRRGSKNTADGDGLAEIETKTIDLSLTPSKTPLSFVLKPT
jgi:hypothetical protein